MPQLSQNPPKSPVTAATKDWPAAAAQTVEIIRSSPVAISTMGRGAPSAAPATYSTSWNPSAIEPVTKTGIATSCGSPCADT